MIRNNDRKKVRIVSLCYQFFDGGIDTPVSDTLAHWFQGFIITGLYRAFAVVMNDEGALFGLLGIMPANVHQCLDNPVKRIDIIIPNNQVVCIIKKIFNGHIMGLFRGDMFEWFHDTTKVLHLPFA